MQINQSLANELFICLAGCLPIEPLMRSSLACPIPLNLFELVGSKQYDSIRPNIFSLLHYPIVLHVRTDAYFVRLHPAYQYNMVSLTCHGHWSRIVQEGSLTMRTEIHTNSYFLRRKVSAHLICVSLVFSWPQHQTILPSIHYASEGRLPVNQVFRIPNAMEGDSPLTLVVVHQQPIILTIYPRHFDSIPCPQNWLVIRKASPHLGLSTLNDGKLVVPFVLQIGHAEAELCQKRNTCLFLCLLVFG